MENAYPGRNILSEQNRQMMEKWDEEDPVSEWECRRAKIIREIQNNENKILSTACLNISAGKVDKSLQLVSPNEKQNQKMKMPQNPLIVSLMETERAFLSQGVEASENDFDLLKLCE